MMSLIGRRWPALAAAFAMLLAPLSQAYAMRVSPMVFEMEASGSASVARMEVQNVNQENLAFETRVYRLTFDKDGNQVEEPADDKFLISDHRAIKKEQTAGDHVRFSADAGKNGHADRFWAHALCKHASKAPSGGSWKAEVI